MSTNRYLSTLVDYKSTQIGNYKATSSAFYVANLNVSTAQAAYDYRNALEVEQSTIIKYNDIEFQLESLIAGIPYIIRGGGVQDGGANNISYYTTLTPPPGKEIDYNTLYLMLSSMSTAMFSTSKVREMLEANQTEIFNNNLKQILDIEDDKIFAAEFAYSTAVHNRNGVISTMSGLSTRIAMDDAAEAYYLSELSTLSSIYMRDISTYRGITAEIAAYDLRENILSGFLRSTLQTLNMLSTQSSIYSISVGVYMQSYIGWSTLEGVAQSYIDGYMVAKRNIINVIHDLDGQITTLTGTVGTQFSDLITNANTYYSDVTADLNNELDVYKYGVQEWNSFIGYICSELLIQKLNLYTTIDSLTFSLQANISQEQRTNLSQQKAQHASMQNTIQSIITALNILDTPFSDLLQLVEIERDNKIAFVNTRSILTDHEITVLRDPTQKSVVQTQYIYQLGILNSRVNNINTNILERNRQMTDLNAIINPQLAILSGLNLFSYTVPDAIDTTVQPFNIDKTEYALLMQIDYGLNSATYPLVLTNVDPTRTSTV
jgi:hypothetical protein